METLNLFEAYQALAKGLTVQPISNGDGYPHRLENGKLYYWDAAGEKRETDSFYKVLDMTFRIVPAPKLYVISASDGDTLHVLDEVSALKLAKGVMVRLEAPAIAEKKSLSFEEAVDALRAGRVLNVDGPSKFTESIRLDRWENALPILDLAERRGWNINQGEG